LNASAEDWPTPFEAAAGSASPASQILGTTRGVDGPWRSWWEAVPVENGDVLKLRWKDFPNLSLITRARLDLALLCPDAA
jgi:hypothetical protein